MAVPFAFLLQACAQTPPAPKRYEPPPPPPPLQFLVYAQLGNAALALSPDAVAKQASLIAEVPVRHDGVRTDGRHNLVLVCANVAACRVSTQRLRSQAEFFAAVQEAPRGVFGP